MRQRITVPRFLRRVLHSLWALPALLCSAACAHPTEPPASGATPAATTATPPSADPAAVGVIDRRGKGGASAFVAHMVSDFDAFKKFFEDGAEERAKAGVKGHLLTRLSDGRVVVHLFADDLDALKLTLASPAMQKYLDRPGSPDASLVWLAYDELIKLPAKPPTQQTYSLFLKLRMSDLVALRTGFVERQALFTDYGVIASGLHHSVDQSDRAYLHFVGTDAKKLEALSKRPEFLEWVATGGTTEPPQIFLGEDVSRSRTYYPGFN